MADNTGAPWLLPYPEDTDLVRDGADDIEALATAVASGLTAANTGIGTNLVSAIRTSVFTASLDTSTDSAAVLTATITPTSTSSKVLIIASVSITDGSFRMYRNGSAIVDLGGDAAGIRTRSAGGFDEGSPRNGGSAVFVGLDSPGTTSATSYDFRIRHDSTGTFTVFVNQGNTDDDTGQSQRTSSTITLIEVAA